MAFYRSEKKIAMLIALSLLCFFNLPVNASNTGSPVTSVEPVVHIVSASEMKIVINLLKQMYRLATPELMVEVLRKLPYKHFIDLSNVDQTATEFADFHPGYLNPGKFYVLVYDSDSYMVHVDVNLPGLGAGTKPILKKLNYLSTVGCLVNVDETATSVNGTDNKKVAMDAECMSSGSATHGSHAYFYSADLPFDNINEKHKLNKVPIVVSVNDGGSRKIVETRIICVDDDECKYPDWIPGNYSNIAQYKTEVDVYTKNNFKDYCNDGTLNVALNMGDNTNSTLGYDGRCKYKLCGEIESNYSAFMTGRYVSSVSSKYSLNSSCDVLGDLTEYSNEAFSEHVTCQGDEIIRISLMMRIWMAYTGEYSYHAGQSFTTCDELKNISIKSIDDYIGENYKIVFNPATILGVDWDSLSTFFTPFGNYKRMVLHKDIVNNINNLHGLTYGGLLTHLVDDQEKKIRLVVESRQHKCWGDLNSIIGGKLHVIIDRKL